MKYFLAENGQPAGPFEAGELMQRGLTPDSLVWNESMDNWRRAADVPELAALLAAGTPQAAAGSQHDAYMPRRQGEEIVPPQWTGQQAHDPESAYMPQGAQQPVQQQWPQSGQQSDQQWSQPAASQQPASQQPQWSQFGQGGQQQWAQPQYSAPVTPPNSWKVPAIILTVVSAVCCLNPLSLACGIVGIVYASKVSSFFGYGNIDAANGAAKTAKTWTIVGLVLLVLSAIACVLLMVVGYRGFPGVAEEF